MDDDEVPEPSEEAKRLVDERRRLFPGAPDPEARHVLGWSAMPAEARAAACVAALLARWPLEIDWMRYDPRLRAVFVVRPDPDVKGRSTMASRVVPRTVDESLAVVRTMAGHRWVEVERLVRGRR
jgi:hypothetical protein